MNRSRSHLLRGSRGFTLVEAIATVVVIGTVGAIASQLIYTASRVHENAVTRSELSNQLSIAVERIVTELRTIRLKSSATPVQPDITSMTASSITFNAETSTRTLTLSGTNLVLTGSVGSSVTLASNISAFTITGLDASNAALPATPSVAQLQTLRQFSITITGTRAGQTETLRTRVFVRAIAAGSGAE